MSPTRVRRAFPAAPVRTASTTWTAIVDMIAPVSAPGREILSEATGLAAGLIAAEAWRSTPLIVSGVGPQLRVYCLYGEDAILGEETNEDPLSWSPTAGDWHMEIPCPLADLYWVTSALAGLSARLQVVDNTITRENAAAERATTSVPVINEEAFLRG